MNLRPLGPQPADSLDLCVPPRPLRPFRPRSRTHGTYQTMHPVPGPAASRSRTRRWRCALLAILHSVLLGKLDPNCDVAHAAGALRSLGLPPAEAGEIARRPLPSARPPVVGANPFSAAGHGQGLIRRSRHLPAPARQPCARDRSLTWKSRVRTSVTGIVTSTSGGEPAKRYRLTGSASRRSSSRCRRRGLR